MQQLDVVLLQPGTVLEHRLDGGADALAAYLKSLGSAAEQAVSANPQQLPAGGFVVVALRPGGHVHTWFDFKPALDDKTTAALAHAVDMTPPTAVKQGNVVFALRVSIWGGRPPVGVAPVPPEWRAAARQAGHKLDLDNLIDQTWPR